MQGPAGKFPVRVPPVPAEARGLAVAGWWRPVWLEGGVQERSRGHMGHIEGIFRDLSVQFLRRTFRKMGSKCPHVPPWKKTIAAEKMAIQIRATRAT
jgi:alpha/beta superfamily hydrolase